MTKAKKQEDEEAEIEQRIGELTQDLQRTRADFENYRKRSEMEKVTAREAGQASAILKLLPVIDNIERAVVYTPEELKDNSWVQSIAGLAKNLEKALDGLNLKRIDAAKGVRFSPEVHEAIQFDEDAQGDLEVIEEQLQAGYMINGHTIRPAMVKVTREHSQSNEKQEEQEEIDASEE
jgi:molecular chaperone GrpE